MSDSVVAKLFYGVLFSFCSLMSALCEVTTLTRSLCLDHTGISLCLKPAN